VAFDELVGELGLSPAVLRGPDRRWDMSRQRAAICHVLVRRLGYGVGDVASLTGRAPATVSAMLSRVADRIVSDRLLRQAIGRLDRIVEIARSDPD
jgi:hypothetical protein